MGELHQCYYCGNAYETTAQWQSPQYCSDECYHKCDNIHANTQLSWMDYENADFHVCTVCGKRYKHIWTGTVKDYPYCGWKCKCIAEERADAAREAEEAEREAEREQLRQQQAEIAAQIAAEEAKRQAQRTAERNYRERHNKINKEYNLKVGKESGVVIDGICYNADKDKVLYCEDKDISEAVIIDGCRTIALDAFKDCKNLRSVKCPDSLTWVQDGAFYGCRNLKSIDLGNNIETLGEDVFYDCTRLETVALGNSLRNTYNEDPYFFHFCPSIKRIIVRGGRIKDKRTRTGLFKPIREKEATRRKLMLSSVPLWLAALCVLSGGVGGIFSAAFVIAATVWNIFCSVTDIYDFDGDGDEALGSRIFYAVISFAPIAIVSLVLTHNYIGVGAILGGGIALALAIPFFELLRHSVTPVSLVAGLLSLILPVAAIGLVVAISATADLRLEKKAAKQMEKWYTPEADVVVGQNFARARYRVDQQSGKISTEYEVKFGKNGLAGRDIYTVDTATRTISTLDEKDKEAPNARYFRYFPDGSACYELYEDGTASIGYPKEGAAFNAAQATEVIGKTFSGKWSDKFTATVTFGKDGRASVRFSDGDKASGAYIASDEDNMVLYNHKDAGVWHTFTYSDDDSGVRFERMYAKRYEDGTFQSWLRTDTHDDWKKK